MLEHILHVLEDWSLGIFHTPVYIVSFIVPVVILVLVTVTSLRKNKKVRS